MQSAMSTSIFPETVRKKPVLVSKPDWLSWAVSFFFLTYPWIFPMVNFRWYFTRIKVFRVIAPNSAVSKSRRLPRETDEEMAEIHGGSFKAYLRKNPQKTVLGLR